MIRSLTPVVLSLLSLPLAGVASAADFQVDNAVYAGGDERPSVETTTVFVGQVVYDFLESPPETIIFDRQAGQFTLIDRARRVRSVISLREVLDVVHQRQRRAAEADSAYLRFLARPELDPQLDPTTGEVSLSSRWLSYRAEPIEPESPEVPAQYRSFADAYGQINTILNPRAIPPMARMMLNAELAARGVIPRRIELTLRPRGKSDAQAIRLRSEHRYKPTVSPDARERVAAAQRRIDSYPLVSLQQYRHAERAEQ